MTPTTTLNQGAHVALDASGAGEIRIGPTNKGPQNWRVTGLILKTTRPGQAPVPRAEVWLNSQDENGAQGLTYDGSFANGRCNFVLSRGQEIIIRWTGGQAADIAYATVTGDKW